MIHALDRIATVLDLADRADLRERFDREAKTIASLPPTHLHAL